MAALIGQAESLKLSDEWEPVAGGFGTEDRGESREPRAQELPPHLEKWEQAEWPPVNARRPYISQLCASGLLRRECQNHQARNKTVFLHQPKNKAQADGFPRHLFNARKDRTPLTGGLLARYQIGFSGVALGWDDL